MKKLILLFAFLCLCAGSSMAQYDESHSFIGLFSDMAATETDCTLDLVQYAVQSIYIIAAIEESRIPNGITALQFRFENYFDDPVNLLSVSITFESPLVIGLPPDDIAVAFSPPVLGHLIHVGTIDIISNNVDWADGGYVLSIVAAEAPGAILIVDDLFQEWAASGGFLTISCPDVCLCNPTTATEAANWGSIKALY